MWSKFCEEYTMSETFTLKASPRTVVGKKVASLRRQGILPATVYGKGVDNLTIQVNSREFGQIFRKAGRTGVISLNIEGKPTTSVFVHTFQRHPLTREIIHVDFLAVNLREEVTVEVPVTIVGESPLVARDEAVINLSHNILQVRALPTSIPQHIEVDVSGLDAFDKSIFVRDLATSDSYTILTDGDELLVSLTASRTEAAAEEAASEEETAPEAPAAEGEGESSAE